MARFLNYIFVEYNSDNQNQYQKILIQLKENGKLHVSCYNFEKYVTIKCKYKLRDLKKIKDPRKCQQCLLLTAAITRTNYFLLRRQTFDLWARNPVLNIKRDLSNLLTITS